MALPSPEEEGRAKLKGYKMLGFIGSGTFAEVSKYVRVGGALPLLCVCEVRSLRPCVPTPTHPPTLPRSRCCSKCSKPAAWLR